MVDVKTKKYIEKVVKENFTPGNLNLVLENLEEQIVAPGATDEKKVMLGAFIDGIKRSLGKVS